MWFSRFFAVLTVALFTIALPVALRADTDDEKARAAFRTGSELFEKQQFAAAATQFRVAYRHKPSWRLFYNIGQCETGARRYGLALESFERYLVEGGDDIPVDRREEVRKETGRLRDMVGMLNVTGPDGAEVFVNGVKRGDLPLPGYIPVSAAVEHTVSGTLAGKSLSVRTIRLMTGQTFDVTLTEVKTTTDATGSTQVTQTRTDDPQGEPTEGPDRVEEPITPETAGVSTQKTAQPGSDVAGVSTGRRLRIAGMAAMGAGVAALTGGIVTGIMAKNQNDEITAACLDGFEDAGVACVLHESDRGLVDRRNTLGTLSTVLFTAGGVMAATGAVLFVLGTRKRERVAGRLNAAPVMTADAAGIIAAWRF